MTLAAILVCCPLNAEKSHLGKIGGGWRAVPLMCIVLHHDWNNNNKRGIMKANGRKANDERQRNGKWKTSVKLKWPTFTLEIITLHCENWQIERKKKPTSCNLTYPKKGYLTCPTNQMKLTTLQLHGFIILLFLFFIFITYSWVWKLGKWRKCAIQLLERSQDWLYKKVCLFLTNNYKHNTHAYILMFCN